jgi:hypothetical protein
VVCREDSVLEFFLDISAPKDEDTTFPGNVRSVNQMMPSYLRTVESSKDNQLPHLKYARHLLQKLGGYWGRQVCNHEECSSIHYGSATPEVVTE